MKDAIKKIIATIIFLGIGIGLFRGVTYVLRPTTGSFERSNVTGFYGEEKDSLDMVVIGSSAAYRYFNSMTLWDEYNITSYNFATPGQSCFIVEYLMDEVLKTQKPDVFVVEMRRFLKMENKEELPQRWPLIANNMPYSWNRLKLINYLYDSVEDKFNNYFDILQYHDNWEINSLGAVRYLDNASEHKFHGTKITGEVKELKQPVIDKEIEPLPISGEVEEALISLLEKCKKEDLDVIFVSTPFKINNELQAKSKYIEELVESRGFEFLDMNHYYEEIGLDFRVELYDKNHVNLVGAEKVSKFFGKYLLENYNITTEHDEAVIKDWNAKYKNYNKEAEPIRQKIEELRRQYE